jgi:hypothetical protein
MQPQSKSVCRAGLAAIAAPDPGTVGMASKTARASAPSGFGPHRWRQRRELRSMSQREIADFCPKLTDALHEADKPFWRA